MKLAIVCGGKPQLFTEESLQFIGDSVDMVVKTLEANQWICIPFRKTTSSKDYIELFTGYKGNKIDEFLFYYIGHGTGSKSEEFEIHFESHSLTIHQIKKNTKEALGRYPKKMALVIDACYSGHAVDSKSDIKDIEILTAKDRDSKAFECNIKKKTEFSYWFCKTFEIVQDSDIIKLDNIAKNILNEMKSDVFYLPNPSTKTEKIIIGYNKEINQVIEALKKTYLTNKDMKSSLLKYYSSTSTNYKNIIKADDFNALFNILLNDSQYLYCLLKDRVHELSFFEGMDEVDCDVLEQRALKYRKIDKIIIRVDEDVNGKFVNSTVSGYLGYVTNHYSPTKSKTLDLSAGNFLKALPEYIKEVLVGKKARTIELQLILPNELLKLNYQNEEINSRFNILKRLQVRMKNYHQIDFDEKIEFWYENSKICKEKKDETMCDILVHKSEISLFNKHDESVCVLSNETSSLDKIHDWGVPIVFYPHENYEIIKNIAWNNCRVREIKNSITKWMSEEFAKPNSKSTHFIYDDYNDVGFLDNRTI